MGTFREADRHLLVFPYAMDLVTTHEDNKNLLSKSSADDLYSVADAGADVSVTDLYMGSVQNVSKKATVVFAEQQNISKRHPVAPSLHGGHGRGGEAVRTRMQGPPAGKQGARDAGIEGQGWEPVVRRTDLDLYADVT